MDGCMGGWVDGWVMGVWMGGWVDGWVGVWMYGPWHLKCWLSSGLIGKSHCTSLAG